MMNIKIIKSIFVCAIMLCGITAQAASVYVGYCDGQLGDRGYSKTGSGTISAAIIFPKAAITKYEGAKITAIRIGLITTDGISNVRGWIREDLESENLAEASLSSFTSGWNEVALSTPITISGNDSIAIGYSFDQSKSVKCMSVAGSDEKNGYWVAKDGSWQNRSDDYVGSLSVEIVLEGDNVPDSDLEILSFTADNEQVKYGDDFVVTCITRNSALKQLQDIVYSCYVNETLVGQTTVEKTMDYRDCDTISYTLNSEALSIGIGTPVKIIAKSAGDVKLDNDTAFVYMSTYTDTYTRKVLLEEFTSEFCSNCPRAIETIATVLSMGYEDKTVCVSHHSGYQNDWLTTEHDEGLEWFYGDDGTFAPAGMFDRTQNDAYGSEVPVFSIAYSDTYRPMLDVALEAPAFVKVEPTATYDENSRKLQISVSAEKMPIFDYQCPESRINIYIIEDSILAHSQAGYSSSTFRHRHVFRESLTGQWGTLMEWAGDSHTSQYETTLADEIDAKYVRVVAFISNYDANDRNNCKVYNSGEFELKSLSTSIHGIYSESKNVSRVEYYDMNGMRIMSPERGLYIKKTVFTDGSVDVDKMFLSNR